MAETKSEWKAEVLDKNFSRGLLTVRVRFFDNLTGGSFEEEFNSNQKQPMDWPREGVERKLRDLNAIAESDMGLSTGAVISLSKESVLDEDPVEKAKNEARAEYRRKLDRFNKYVSVIVIGFTTEEAQEFRDLKQWLTDNFIEDYVELFN